MTTEITFALEKVIIIIGLNISTQNILSRGQNKLVYFQWFNNVLEH